MEERWGGGGRSTDLEGMGIRVVFLKGGILRAGLDGPVEVGRLYGSARG